MAGAGRRYRAARQRVQTAARRLVSSLRAHHDTAANLAMHALLRSGNDTVARDHFDHRLQQSRVKVSRPPARSWQGLANLNGFEHENLGVRNLGASPMLVSPELNRHLPNPFHLFLLFNVSINESMA